MSWIESHQEIKEHPKTKRLARRLGISIATAIGHIHLFWWWAMDYAENGDLSKFDYEDIAEAAMWEGSAKEFVDAMVDCGPGDTSGFLDRDGDSLYVHDWMEYMGKLFEQREKNRKRQEKHRDKNKVANNSDNITVTSRDDNRDITVTSRDDNRDITVTSRVSHTATVPDLTDITNLPTNPCQKPIPEEIGIGDIPLEDVPAPMREAVELFLLKTRRKTITPGDLSAIRALEAIHTPARVSKEITAQMGKFVQRGRDPTELTLEYVYEVLKHQKSGPSARKSAARGNPPEPPWAYTVTYEALASLWDKHMPGVGFMPAPEPVRKWKQLLAERIAENPSQRDSLSWWENRLREIDGSDIASARGPVNADGMLWRLELSMLLESEDKLQKLVTGRYRNRENIRAGPRFKPYEGPEDDYDPGTRDGKED